jgi:hypothetical protein
MHQAKNNAVLEGEAVPSEVVRLLDEVDQRLRQNEPGAALELLKKSAQPSPWRSNAMAVCHLRLGDARAAQHILQELATESGFMRFDVPDVFRLNLAVARLLAGNLLGFEAALKTLSKDRCPAVTAYWDTLRQWKRSMTFGERLRYAFTREAPFPIELGFPPGELR